MWYRMSMRCEKEKIKWELDLWVEPELVQLKLKGLTYSASHYVAENWKLTKIVYFKYNFQREIKEFYNFFGEICIFCYTYLHV